MRHLQVLRLSASVCAEFDNKVLLSVADNTSIAKRSVGIGDLRETVVLALVNLGLTAPHAEIVAEVLLYAESRGKSQGLLKILERTVLPTPGYTDISVESASPVISRVQANGNIGMVVLRTAADIAVAKTSELGMTLVTTSGTASSTGSIGYYADRIARHGLIAMVFAGSPKVMALHGGVSPVTGTNPVAFGIPTASEPLVFDMATSAITWFDVISRMHREQDLPPRTAIDAAGNDTLSAAAAMQGALLPFAGTKGSGLALMFECLVGPLCAASILGDEDDNRGNVIVAINPAVVLGNNSYPDRVSELMLRARAAGTAEFRFPGEGSSAKAQAVVASGIIDVDAATLDALQKLAAQRG